MLLQGGRDGRLARRGEAREPDGQAALFAKLVALAARERRVPGDVSAFAHVRTFWKLVVLSPRQLFIRLVSLALHVCVLSKGKGKKRGPTLFWSQDWKTVWGKTNVAIIFFPNVERCRTSKKGGKV